MQDVLRVLPIVSLVFGFACSLIGTGAMVSPQQNKA